MLKRRNQLYQQWLKTKNETDHELYKRYRNMVTNEIRTAQSNFYQSQINQNKNNFFKIINEIKGKQKSNSDKLCPNQANSFFSSIGTSLDSLLPQSTHSFMPAQSLQSFYFHPITISDVRKAIKQLKPKKSSGADGISPYLINIACDIVAPYLLKIFQASFDQHNFPEKWKTAKVIPIHKSGNPNDPNNYRPIALIPTFAKVFEKILTFRLTNYFEQHAILSVSQNGFRKNKSTISTVAAMCHELGSKENSTSDTAVFIDLKKAFDTVNHVKLIQKLERYGVRGKALLLLTSYLSNRHQFVEIDGIRSELRPMKTGVPQGSTLGPLLFLIYINDMPDIVNSGNVYLFADDTAILNSCFNESRVDELNADLKSVSAWLIENRLTSNVSKTQLVTFSRCKNRPAITFGDKLIGLQSHS